MSNVVRSTFQAASRELIAKLVKAGYLRRALRHDADAITAAIARLKHAEAVLWTTPIWTSVFKSGESAESPHGGEAVDMVDQDGFVP